ncbi:hypothetical protein Pla110_45150 [Polystyrenella longa]|uniref:DUF4328 domain-containing protein n=1 Tax=Polystyrenella longa TaxID=2528007 RepID=A0A518CU45_9PLAN|nr:DUF4328 domain-containing protein [Polystyrenella longa]QDU82753.1 hypothetical protein Pla110_45150 [Polystyrenella longa]
MAISTDYEYTSTRSISRFVVGVCLVRAVCVPVWVGISLFFIYLEMNGQNKNDDFLFKLATNVELGFGIFAGIVNWVFLIASLVWIYRSSVNAFALSVTQPPAFTPGWATLFFFIPFVNFGLGLPIVSRIWNHSVTDLEKEGRNWPSPVVLTWWLVWVGGTILSMIVTFWTTLAAPEWTYQGQLSLVIVEVASIVVMVRLVRQLHQKQEEKHAILFELGTTCPACGEQVRNNLAECPVCGETLLATE